METNKVSDTWISGVCQMCYNCCGIKIHFVNGVMVGFEGDPDCPQNYGKLCAKGHSAIMSLYDPDRLIKPLKRTNPEKGLGIDPKWQEISWEEAINTVADKLKEIRKDDPRKIAVLSFDRDIYPFSLATVLGTPNRWVGGANYFCGNSVHLMTYLTQGAFVVDPDLDYCNHLILIGVQGGFMTEPHAVTTATKTAEARARGMKVIVVDPVLSTAAAKADEWVPIRPGTDGALALAMLDVLLNEVAIYDAEFIKKYTNGPYLIGPNGRYLRDTTTNKVLVWDVRDGTAKTYDSPDIYDFSLEGSYEVNGTIGRPAFQLLKEHVKKYTCEEVAKITTIPEETIRRIAKEYGKAARIGSKITIEGKELPYRPACVAYKKGVSQHKHSGLSTFAIHLLNIVTGSIDVPGGMLAANSRLLPGDVCAWSWDLMEGPDGMLQQGQRLEFPMYPSPGREPKPPETVQLLELFPLAAYSEPMVALNIADSEKYKFPYKVEALLHCRTNIMMSTVNPEQVAAWLKKVPFIASFATGIDETVEFADIVIPDAHQLERLDLFINDEWLIQQVGLGDWCYMSRHPVVEAPPGIRHWVVTFMEIADRAGFLKDFNHMVNINVPLKEEYRLDVDRRYSWEDIHDRYAKSIFGPERDLAWFKEHVFIKWPRKVEEVYPRVFIKQRIPIYLEYFKEAGEGVKSVTQEMGIPWWDVSDYQPLPDWKPCPAYVQNLPGYDLYAVPYKLPFHYFSVTANNVLLNELSEHHSYAYYIQINGQTANNKGIIDGDLICLETDTGRQVSGQARVTEGVHPEVVGIAGIFGHWAKALSIAKGKGVHFNTLITADLEHIDMISSAVDTCVKVRVSKVDKSNKK